MRENGNVTNCQIGGKSPEREVITLAFFRQFEPSQALENH